MDGTTPREPGQPDPPQFLVTDALDCRQQIDTCPNAQCLSALCPELRSPVVLVLPCKQWSCRYCARRKIAELAHKTRCAKPNRLLTLTVDPKLHDSPRAAFDATRAKVPELIRKLRTRFGDIEYLRVTELTKAGFPHYHMLIRSGYLPQPLVKSLWNDMTGAIIVDLRQVKQSFAAYHYLVKYLAKLHKIEWTERHVSYSRRFFAPEDEPPKSPYTFLEKESINSHPSTLLASHYKGCTVKRLSPCVLQILDAEETAGPQPSNPF